MLQREPASHLQLLIEGTEGLILTADFRRGRREKDFVDLLGGLDHGCAVYELTPFGLQGEPIPTPTISSFADAYCEEIVAHLDGPFFVAGFSQGGPLAFGVASRLQALRCDVSTLVLVDSHPAGASIVAGEFRRIVRGMTGQQVLPALTDEALTRACDILVLDPEASLAELSRALFSLDAPMVNASQHTASLYDQLVQRYRSWLAYLVAAANFQPDPYRGTIYLFVAGSPEEANAIWLPHGDIVVRGFDAPHHQLLDDPRLRSEFIGLLGSARIGRHL